MRLGLGLGLGNTQGGAAVADWPNWDGSNDGSIVNVQTAGARGAPAVACIDSTKALIAYTEAATQTDDLRVTILTRAAKAMTEQGSVDVTSAQQIQQKPTVCRLSDTRALVGYLNDTGATDRYEVSLIDVSGTTPSVLDTAQETTVTATAFTGEIVRINDSKAIYDAGTHLMIISISSDTISIGTPLARTGNLDGTICLFSETSGAYCDNRDVVHFTISGTTITETALSETRFNSVTTSGDVEIVAVSSTEAVIIFEETAADGSPVDALPVTWNGTNFTLGSSIELFNDRVFTMDSRWAWLIPGTRSIMVVWQQVDAITNGYVSIVTSSDSHVLSEDVSDVVVFPSIQSDHLTGDFFPDTDALYALVVCQEETTSPVKQIGTKVLYGA